SLLTVELVSEVQHGDLNLNADGSFTYTPDPGFTGVDHFAYRVTDGSLSADAIVAITVQTVAGSVNLDASPGSVRAGGTATVSGTVYDASANPLAGVTVELSADAGAIAARATTAPDGSFQATFVAPAQAGPVTITATVAGSQPPVQATLTLPVVAGAAASLTLSASPSTVVEGGPSTLTGRVQDAFGNPVEGVPVLLSATAGTVTESVYTDVDGAYEALFTAPGVAGPVLVEASVPGLGLRVASVLVVAAASGDVTGATGGRSDGANPLTLGGAGTPTPELTLTGTGGSGAGSLIAYASNPVGTAPPGTSPVYFDAAVVSGHGFTEVTLRRCGFAPGTEPRAYWWDGTGWREVSPQGLVGDCVVLGPFRAAGTSPTLAQLTGTPFAVALQGGGSGGNGGGGGGSGGGGGAALERPLLSDVRPNVGPVTGGTRVVLGGRHFTGATAVRFGDAPALRFTVLSDEEIAAVAPPGTGTVEVTVTGPAGTSSASREALRFTYLPEPAMPFTDLPAEHWAYADVQLLAEFGAVGGFPDGSFRPEAPVTRAELVKLLALTLGLAHGDGVTDFADVPPDAWYAPYVSAAVRAGIVQGTSATMFSPDDEVTREQVAALLARALGLKAAVALSFKDADAVSAWAVEGVRAAFGAGLVGGYPDGAFRPQAPMTRAEAAAVLVPVVERQARELPPG
ncbi:MAG TPA: S-layer homology domain-containing protein, partial [Trebonia sp.]